ncbi:putative glucose-repressible protein [Botrytis fragariae]|uniref:Putative glucose-repressible protein n=1 Tax=Botrytis fragariae TaxID=1964551 RepID=A0A8H6AU72_9HELO|nr:putative glucose-repressible protein [Botrytis fragariae]KAF5873470.1 putative glucose-repressible protein [Botrytis fragariae]
MLEVQDYVNASNYVAEKTKAGGKESSKEMNKTKDRNMPISTRVHAAVKAVGDKIEKHGHDAKASYHKEVVKH